MLLIAPLYDNKGTVRYFLGAQIDVSSLIDQGRGFDTFEKLLARERVDSRMGHRQSRRPDEILAELGAMLNDGEMASIRRASASAAEEAGGRASPSTRSGRGGRRILGMEDDEIANRQMWPDRSLGPSGRLPGVYQNYLLVRPYPSLRITFTSPALRIPGLLQTKFMDRIGGPSHVREGIVEAFSQGTSVTAKVQWNPLATQQGTGRASAQEPRQRWIHCTPLFGSDEQVGVWMIVMVEKEEVTGRLNHLSLSEHSPRSPRPSTATARGGDGGSIAASNKFNSERLYQEYLRREGKEERSNVGVGAFSRSSSKD